MGGEEFRELEASLSGARRVCKHLKNISLIFSAVYLVAWLLLLVLMTTDAATAGVDARKLKGISYVASYGVVTLLLLFVAYRSFSDVVNGESPFTMKQVSRFRYAALLLVALVIIDTILSTGFTYAFNMAGVDYSALGNHGMEQRHLRINAEPLFFAVILYGISVLFRYGVLLQRLTDETD
ncbi:hypothetical protein [Eggerthella timonensis]|uniref:hypothetical protein n=1 Tax=Eggerthella timonensis TaxID=1871008 RepID=UPI000C781366|nr:hypothetical protein [Eggerthella timonensis]